LHTGASDITASTNLYQGDLYKQAISQWRCLVAVTFTSTSSESISGDSIVKHE
jgi:hypothetical protein